MAIVPEMGLIGPPMGFNVFVVKGVAEDIPVGKILAGILPFRIAMAACIAIRAAFPEITLLLPNTMIR